MAELILASASPRRLELLKQIGVPCQVQPVNIPEIARPEEKAERFVERLAREKAEAGLRFQTTDEVILGSDTVVVCDGQIMGKPESKQHGFEMLQRLSGREHQVMTAIALTNGEQIRSQVVTTSVCFHEVSVDQCHRYWDSGEPQDKAGGYGIQGLGAVFVASMKGSYSAVVGLPLAETAKLLETFGVPVWQTP